MHASFNTFDTPKAFPNLRLRAPPVILNLVGFSAFWLPPSCGERMGLSITAMLAALASDIVIAANLPAASEMTWFSTFSILSTAFAFLSLVESVVVLYFYYKSSEDLGEFLGDRARFHLCWRYLGENRGETETTKKFC